jgi:nucleoside-diphosphate-sugar epimerase
VEDPRVTCVQADCSEEEYLDRLFEDGFDFIVNMAAETDLNKAESFHAKAVDITLKVATAAAKTGCKRFIQVSTASVYASSSKAATEAAKTAPWTTIAEYAFKAEEALKSVPGLPWVILRPAVVYGPGDVNGLMPR